VKYIVHLSHDNQLDAGLVRRYAESHGCSYEWLDLKADLFDVAGKIKSAAMAVIWNGMQGAGPLASRICRLRGIPVCYVEWGLVPQAASFTIDPLGFCGDSILAQDLSWVTDADLRQLVQARANLQKQYPLQPRGHVLAALQIENDSQILYFSRYRNMHEFISDVEAKYPLSRIIARLHPKSREMSPPFARAEVEQGGEFLDAASQASLVVSTTSTCLYEAGILGVPVVALGDHPLRAQPKAMHERVLAGALALRVDRVLGDMSTVLDRFGIRPL
jgi:hypothetical protein